MNRIKLLDRKIKEKTWPGRMKFKGEDRLRTPEFCPVTESEIGGQGLRDSLWECAPACPKVCSQNGCPLIFSHDLEREGGMGVGF